MAIKKRRGVCYLPCTLTLLRREDDEVQSGTRKIHVHESGESCGEEATISREMQGPKAHIYPYGSTTGSPFNCNKRNSVDENIEKDVDSAVSAKRDRDRQPIRKQHPVANKPEL